MGFGAFFVSILYVQWKQPRRPKSSNGFFNVKDGGQESRCRHIYCSTSSCDTYKDIVFCRNVGIIKSADLDHHHKFQSSVYKHFHLESFISFGCSAANAGLIFIEICKCLQGNGNVSEKCVWLWFYREFALEINMMFCRNTGYGPQAGLVI